MALEPTITITIDPGAKSYTMYATVLAPNGCYFGNGTQVGVPKGVSVTPETEAVILNLERRTGGLCFQMITPVLFICRALPLSPAKKRLSAFVVLEGQVVGAESVAIPVAEQKEMMAFAAPPAATPSGAWIGAGEVGGWIDRMPEATPSVHVRVGMWARTGGYTYNLKMLGPFGFTGRTLLCDLKTKAPAGLAIDVISHTIVPADGPLGAGVDYDSVLVRFEDQSVMGKISTIS